MMCNEGLSCQNLLTIKFLKKVTEFHKYKHILCLIASYVYLLLTLISVCWNYFLSFPVPNPTYSLITHTNTRLYSWEGASAYFLCLQKSLQACILKKGKCSPRFCERLLCWTSVNHLTFISFASLVYLEGRMFHQSVVHVLQCPGRTLAWIFILQWNHRKMKWTESIKVHMIVIYFFQRCACKTTEHSWTYLRQSGAHKDVRLRPQRAS